MALVLDIKYDDISVPKTKLQVPFPEPKNLVEYGTIKVKLKKGAS